MGMQQALMSGQTPSAVELSGVSPGSQSGKHGWWTAPLLQTMVLVLTLSFGILICTGLDVAHEPAVGLYQPDSSVDENQETTFGSALFFCFVTMSTVGFGDFTPDWKHP